MKYANVCIITLSWNHAIRVQMSDHDSPLARFRFFNFGGSSYTHRPVMIVGCVRLPSRLTLTAGHQTRHEAVDNPFRKDEQAARMSKEAIKSLTY